MKKIYSVIALALGLLTFASCEINKEPTFNDKDAFVAFNNASFSCTETDGEISIPVTLASLNGMNTTISYEAVNGTAKAGTNFDLVDGTGTLTFTPDARTQYIKVKIYDPDVTYKGTTRVGGKYTGDLKFKLAFKSTGDVNSSMESSCTVTIKDIDHPMSALLGSYTAKGLDYFAGGMSKWTMSILKDAKDDHMVWFFNIFGNDNWADDDTIYYGIVDEDLSTITVPLGQESEYKYQGTTAVLLLGLDEDFNGYDSGNLVITIQKNANGDVTGLDFGDELGIWAYIPGAGSISVILPGITATKD